MTVLSLFDGMSCGQIALRQCGLPVAAYYASEVDRHAIAQTRLNFPGTVHLGDVRGVSAKELPPIDLLIGGSPCTDFSFADMRLRRLTPTECARLQTVPDWYRWECSETQQYRMLGNGWTVEVIRHIFSLIDINKILKHKHLNTE